MKELIEYLLYHNLTCFNTAFTYISLDLIIFLVLKPSKGSILYAEKVLTLPSDGQGPLWPNSKFLSPSQSLGSGQNYPLLGSSNVVDSPISLLIFFPLLRICFLDLLPFWQSLTKAQLQRSSFVLPSLLWICETSWTLMGFTSCFFYTFLCLFQIFMDYKVLGSRDSVWECLHLRLHHLCKENPSTCLLN